MTSEMPSMKSGNGSKMLLLSIKGNVYHIDDRVQPTLCVDTNK